MRRMKSVRDANLAVSLAMKFRSFARISSALSVLPKSNDRTHIHACIMRTGQKHARSRNHTSRPKHKKT